MTNPTSQALATRDNGPESMIEQYRGSFAMVLPSHVKPDAWVRLSQGLLRRNKSLASAAKANPGSFLSALLDCARLGLEPGDTYHLVPFGNEVTGIVDWTGEVELIYRAGAVSSVKAEIVYANDVFVWEPGVMDRPKHTPPVDPATGNPNWFTADRGDMVGVYAYAVMKDGSTSRVVVYDRKQINRLKALAKGTTRKDSPWSLWEDRMWLKSSVKALAKWVPSSAEYREQVLRQEAAAQDVAGQMHVTLPTADYGPDIPEPLPSDDDVVDAEILPDGVDGETGEVQA
jgi:recombination protein RecT